MIRISSVLLILLIVLGILAFALYNLKGKNGTKIMIFGIELTLVGGIVAMDQSSNLGGVEYLIVLLGLITTIVGSGRE